MKPIKANALELLKKLEGKTIAEVKGVNIDIGSLYSVHIENVEIFCTDGSKVELEGVSFNYGNDACIRVEIKEAGIQ